MRQDDSSSESIFRVHGITLHSKAWACNWSRQDTASLRVSAVTRLQSGWFYPSKIHVKMVAVERRGIEPLQDRFKDSLAHQCCAPQPSELMCSVPSWVILAIPNLYNAQGTKKVHQDCIAFQRTSTKSDLLCKATSMLRWSQWSAGGSNPSRTIESRPRTPLLRPTI